MLRLVRHGCLSRREQLFGSPAAALAWAIIPAETLLWVDFPLPPFELITAMVSCPGPGTSWVSSMGCVACCCVPIGYTAVRWYSAGGGVAGDLLQDCRLQGQGRGAGAGGRAAGVGVGCPPQIGRWAVPSRKLCVNAASSLISRWLPGCSYFSVKHRTVR